MLAQIRDAIATVHPDAPWVVLFFALWGAQYALRRWWPRAWTAVFSWIPADMPELVHHVAQGLPSTLFGAALPALASGGDPRQALTGAFFGALVPLWHHLLKALPGPYQGALGPAKPA